MPSAGFGRMRQFRSPPPGRAPAGRVTRATLRTLALLLPLAALLVGCGGEGSGRSASGQAQSAIPWVTDYEAGLAQARETDKPLMVEVSTTWCAACKRLDEEVFSRSDVVSAVGQFTPVRVDAEQRPDLEKELGVSGYPTIVFLQPDGEELGRLRGAVPYQVMLSEIGKAARKAETVQ